MKDPSPSLKGKSFLWAFVLFFILFSCSAFWGESVGISREVAAILLGISGFIPFLVQAITGYAVDGTWTAKYSRTENQAMYWLMLFVSLVIAFWFSFAAYSAYFKTL